MLWLNQILSVSAGLMSWGMALICVYGSLVCVVPVMHCPALLEEHRRQAERVTCYIGHGSQTHWCVKITAPLTQLGQLHTSVSTATHTPLWPQTHTRTLYIYSSFLKHMCECAVTARYVQRLTILFRSNTNSTMVFWCTLECHVNTLVHEYHSEYIKVAKKLNNNNNNKTLQHGGSCITLKLIICIYLYIL